MTIRIKQKGFALLIVLIAIAIILLLSAIQMKTLFGPGLPSRPVSIEERPWQLEKLIATEGENIKLPRSPKIKLDKEFTITANATRNEAERGTVMITFEPDGHLSAGWNCRYSYDEKTLTIKAEMAGNINVRQMYEDENGRDKSRLFFIAKGKYLKTTTTAAIGTTEEKGTAWLLGWLRPDGRTEGYVTITTDQKWSAAYAFSTQNSEN